MKKTNLELLKELLYIRLVEQSIADFYPSEEMRCPVHLSIGQEAVPVAVSSCLSKVDHVVSAHRSHAHYLARGGSLERMIGELLGRVTGCARGKGGSMHLVDYDVNFTAAVPIVGSSISIGVGVGFGLKCVGKYAGEKVAVYFGDGATEQGVFSESLDLAALYGLPVLFVCENNKYSVYTNIDDRQFSGRSIAEISSAHGVRSWRGFGNDVLQARSIVQEAMSYMEECGKPALIEFETYRWLEHCGPNWDDKLGYRPDGELDFWMDRCPIEILCDSIRKDFHSIDDQVSEWTSQINSEVKEVFERSLRAPFPSPAELYEHVYAP